MCKRFVLLLLAVLLVGLGTSVFAASPADIVRTPYNTAYEYLAKKGVVQGYDDATVRPYQYLNRAEAMKILVLSSAKLTHSAEKYAEAMPHLPLFTDIRQNQWFAPYVEAAFTAGIVKGYADGTLRPERLLTTEEAVTLLIRSTGQAPKAEVATLSDRIGNQSSTWFTADINTAIQRNLIMQQPLLRLGQPIARGQFFDMVYRQMSITEQNIASFSDPTAIAQDDVPSQVASPGGTAISAPQPVVSRSQNLNASEKYFAISMPSLGIRDLEVIHPEDPFTAKGVLAPLSRGVGHLFSYPGGGGKIMIYGHSSGYPWDVSKFTKIFRRVNELQTGDRIYVTHEGKLHTYEVTFEQTIDAEDTSAFNDNGSGEELILYTCWPPDSIAQRYLVHAKKVNAVALQ